MEKLEKNKNIEINDMYKINTNIGIQADITGYGKTASIIGLILRNKMEWDIKKKYDVNGYIFRNTNYNIIRKSSFDKINCNLIIANNSIISQWESELKLTNLKYEIVNTKKKCNIFGIDKLDVIICTSTMYNRFMEQNKNNAWKRIIYDEPGTTHIPAMLNIIFGFMWLVTATPKQIKDRYLNRNTNHFIASLNFNSLQSVFFDSIIIKNDIDYIKNSWKLPETVHEYYDCYQPLSQTTRGLVSTRIQLMIDTGNIKGAIINLGGKESDSIIDLINFKFQEDLIETNQKIEKYKNRQNQELVDDWTNKKNKILQKIDDLKHRYNSFINSSCIICYNELKDPVLFTCCHNILCGKCIIKWNKNNNSCPLCRREIDFQKLIYINMDKSKKKIDNSKITKILTKIDQIVKIINEKKNGKFIIFSEDDSTYNFVINSLKVNDIDCIEVKGNMKTRTKIIDNFKKSKKTSSLFLNSKNNGAGINLQECTDIILYHNMTNSITTQILGRANRIGRKDKLTVHHLCIQNRL
jgi:hypothetical protein